MSSIRIAAFTSLIALGASCSSSTKADPPPPPSQTTVVLVHGAFADGSSWANVIPLLQAKGLHVVAVQNPLTSLSDDVQTTKRAIAGQSGPVVLVGHSWGGTVITEAGNDDKVKALVYVAAFAPSAGQSTADTSKDFPPPPGLATLKVDAFGFGSLPPETVRNHFAPDVSPDVANIIATTQGPIRVSAFEEKIHTPAWASKPNWYVVAANDHMIQPNQERAMAKTIHAQVTELASSHVAMVSHPQEVANVILAAADGID
ncbi:alpha/beta hydrolase [Pendulispora brunnea]|uniref:Alpha/beta hydrolase n=1 Tax=Pendulispora brunnea TaxID=2905690 RepID=A0ABZ2KCR4_9BACT